MLAFVSIGGHPVPLREAYMETMMQLLSGLLVPRKEVIPLPACLVALIVELQVTRNLKDPTLMMKAVLVKKVSGWTFKACAFTFSVAAVTAASAAKARQPAAAAITLLATVVFALAASI